MKTTESPPPAAVGGPTAAANDNMLLFPAGKDPAAVLAWVRDCMREVRRQHAASGMLLTCPGERRHFEQMRALERAILWKYFRDG